MDESYLNVNMEASAAQEWLSSEQRRLFVSALINPSGVNLFHVLFRLKKKKEMNYILAVGDFCVFETFGSSLLGWMLFLFLFYT